MTNNNVSIDLEYTYNVDGLYSLIAAKSDFGSNMFDNDLAKLVDKQGRVLNSKLNRFIQSAITVGCNIQKAPKLERDLEQVLGEFEDDCLLGGVVRVH